MKPQFQAIEDKITRWSPVWVERMRLSEWEIEYVFLDSFYPDDDPEDFKVTAVCEGRHAYYMAKIKWFLPSAIRHDDLRLEQTLVHELCHVLLAHEQSVVDRLAAIDSPSADALVEIYAELRETSTELTCRALWKAWGSAD